MRVSGLSVPTTVHFAGDRAAELETGARLAWSRCLLPDPPGPESAGADDAVVAALHTAQSHADGQADAKASGTDLAHVLQILTQEVTYAKIAAQTGRLFMVHASGVANDAGDAIAFVAPGGTGKTTLVRRLGTRFGYLSDETIAVDDAARLHPYPKPLSIRGRDGLPKSETSPDALRLIRPPEHCTLRRIVLLAREDAHTGKPRVETLDRIDAIAAIAPETSALSALPRPLHWLDALLDRLDPTVRLHYRDVDTVLDLIAGWLGADA